MVFLSFVSFHISTPIMKCYGLFLRVLNTLRRSGGEFRKSSCLRLTLLDAYL